MSSADRFDQLQADIIAWLRSELRVPENRALSPQTSVNVDLGVDGDDGVELVAAFCARYKVAPSAIQLNRYFGPEAGANPISLLLGLARAFVGKNVSRLEPLRISRLVRLAAEAQP